MRAVKSDGLSVKLLTDAPEPAPAPGEALVKVSRVLVSPADAAMAASSGATKPSPESGGTRAFSGIIGGQMVGTVRKINMPADAPPTLAARKNWVGKRVVAGPNIACGACDLCRGGLATHCRSRKVMGSWERDGCMAEWCALPLASLCAVPDSVSDDLASLAVPLSSALHAANMLRAESSAYITVLGDSLLALLTAQTLARMNKSVRVLSARPDRMRLCEKWGIKHRPIDEAGRRQDQDVVVDCTGSSQGLRLALQFVRPRGIILLKAGPALAPMPAGRPLPEVDAHSAWGRPLDLTIAAVNEVQIIGSRDGPIPDALRMLSDNALDALPLITRRFPLSEAMSALAAAISPDHIGVLIEV